MQRVSCSVLLTEVMLLCLEFMHVKDFAAFCLVMFDTSVCGLHTSIEIRLLTDSKVCKLWYNLAQDDRLWRGWCYSYTLYELVNSQGTSWKD